MITKRSKVYVHCLYTQIKCKSINVYIKNRKSGRCLHVSINRNSSLSICFKEQTKQRRTKDEIKEESYID